jgi:serine/threonine protein kinase
VNVSTHAAANASASKLMRIYAKCTHTHIHIHSQLPQYMAPEIFGRRYHAEADMWSVGGMLYQLYARRFPFWDTMEECKARYGSLDCSELVSAIRISGHAPFAKSTETRVCVTDILAGHHQGCGHIL